MDIKSYCQDIKNFEEPAQDIPVVYLPCSHKCYKGQVINRATLTHEQYTDLLSTPKGFKWNKNTGLATRSKRGGCSIFQLSERNKNECIARGPLCTTDCRFLRDFITDVWNVMTPHCRKKLENILVQDYGMSKKEAVEFLEEQELRSAFSNSKPESRCYLSARHEWVKDIADLFAGKLTDYLIGMLSARRTKRVRFVTEAILDGFSDLTGEKCSLENPQNRIQNVQVFAADRIAVWLSHILGDNEQELCREILKDRDDHRHSGDSSESEGESESQEDVEGPGGEQSTAGGSPDVKSQKKQEKSIGSNNLQNEKPEENESGHEKKSSNLRKRSTELDYEQT